jgi:hypothetical protein
VQPSPHPFNFMPVYPILNPSSKSPSKQEPEMGLPRRCATCRDLIVDLDQPPSFEVAVEDVKRSSAKCAVCFLLSQASEIPQGIRESAVQKIEIVKTKPEHAPLLILKRDDSGEKGSYQFLRLFYTTRGMKAEINSGFV